MSLYDDMADQHDLANVHALSTFLERQVRFATCIGRAASDPQVDTPRLPRSTGLGGYLSYIQDLCSTPLPNDILNMFNLITASIEQPSGQNEQTLKSYRDFLAHGGLEPSDTNLRSELNKAVNQNRSAIQGFLARRGGTLLTNSRYQLGDGTQLWPYVISLDLAADSFGLYQCLNAKGVQYYTNSAKSPLILLACESVEGRAISQLVEPPRKEKEADVANRFAGIIEKDLTGLRDKTQTLVRNGHYCPFVIGWNWSTSTGSHYREDHFRVNVSGERQWLRADTWLPYSDFLREVTNWSVVVKQSLHRLEALEDQRRATDAEDFDSSSSMNIPETITTTFVTRETMGGSLSHHKEGNKLALVGAVDESAATATGIPQIFFVTGEAGIGKTFNLMRESHRRAIMLNEMDDSTAPLYLFVSCSGVGIRSIDKLVNDAVIDTKNLNFESVLALCRNGMLVLVIDGFDELLGGVGYGDAFQVLSPVLKNLGTHGTLVLAARSSYLANQYKSNLQTQVASSFTPPNHLIVELQRWSRPEVEMLFQANPSWSSFRSILSAQDWELIGVPFFARTFDTHIKQGAIPENFDNLRWLLIE